MTQAVEGFKVQGLSWRVQGVGFRGPGSEAQVVREGDEAEFCVSQHGSVATGPKENKPVAYLKRRRQRHLHQASA